MGISSVDVAAEEPGPKKLLFVPIIGNEEDPSLPPGKNKTEQDVAAESSPYSPVPPAFVALRHLLSAEVWQDCVVALTKSPEGEGASAEDPMLDGIDVDVFLRSVFLLGVDEGKRWEEAVRIYDSMKARLAAGVTDGGATVDLLFPSHVIPPLSRERVNRCAEVTLRQRVCS